MIVFARIRSCYSNTIPCDFKELDNDVYTCVVTTLDNEDNNVIITAASGVHQKQKTDSNVVDMYIKETKTTFIPEGLGLPFKLRMLRISDSTLKEIQSKNFVGMDNLKQLLLDNNQITMLPDGVFSTLKQLEILNLNSNKLTQIESNTFINNLHLKAISLQKNQIVFLDSLLFKHLNNLILVDLAQNTCIQKKFTGEKSLIELKSGLKVCNNSTELMTTETTEQSTIDDENDISNMFIENAEFKKYKFEILKNSTLREQKLIKEIKNLKLLLDEVENQKETIEQMKQENIINKKKIENLEKDNLKITDINVVQAQTIMDLKIELENSKICLNQNTFNMTCEFDDNTEYTCTASNVEINDINMEVHQVIGKQVDKNTNSDVVELHFVGSSLFYLSKDIFRTFTQLEIVEMQNVKLRQLTNGDFSGASNVKSLNLTNNKLKSIDNEVFQGANQLDTIDLGSNEIEKISSNAFKGLLKIKTLFIDNNYIQELHVETFKDLVNMKTLKLSSNQLKTINGQLFEFNTKLYRLFLNGNQINEIGEEFLNNSKKLKKFYITSNLCIDDSTDNTSLHEIIDEIKKKCKKTMNCKAQDNIIVEMQEVEIQKKEEIKNLNEKLTDCKSTLNERK